MTLAGDGRTTSRPASRLRRRRQLRQAGPAVRRRPRGWSSSARPPACRATRRPTATAAPAGDTIYLRVTSDGTNLTAALSADGQTFTPVGRSAALAGITNPKIGLFALNGGTAAPVVDATFDWFQFTPGRAGRAGRPVRRVRRRRAGQVPVGRDRAGGPDGYRVTGGALQIDVPNGDIYGGNNTGPRTSSCRTRRPATGRSRRRSTAACSTSSTSRPACSCTATTTTT